MEARGAVPVGLSQPMLRQMYLLICLINAVLILVTECSDLGFGFAQRRSISQFDLRLEATWQSGTQAHYFFSRTGCIGHLGTHSSPRNSTGSIPCGVDIGGALLSWIVCG
jgi:hypothetical protein